MNKSHLKAQKKAQKPVAKVAKRKVATAAKKVVARKVTKQASRMISSAAAPISAPQFVTTAPTAAVVAKKAVKANFASIQKMPTFQSQNTALFRQTNKQFSEENKKLKDYLEFSLASPNIAPYNKASTYAVYITAAHGERGILRNAAPAIYTLRPGAIRVFEEQGAQPKTWFAPTGVARVANDDKALTVTASELIPIDDLDVEAARKLMDQSTAALAAATEGVEKHRHTVNLRVAQAIVRSIERFGSKH